MTPPTHGVWSCGWTHQPTTQEDNMTTRKLPHIIHRHMVLHPVHHRDQLTADYIRKTLEVTVEVCTMGALYLLTLDDLDMYDFAADVGWTSQIDRPCYDALYAEIDARNWAD